MQMEQAESHRSAPTLVGELLVAECTLKAKRLLALGLHGHGFDVDAPLLSERLGLELSRGGSLVSLLRSRMQPAEVACLFSERTFGIQRPAVMAKLPYVLAHGYHVVDLLVRLAQPATVPLAECCFAGAAFNLACVLLDHITDRMHATDQILQALSADDLTALSAPPGDLGSLARLLDRHPCDEIQVFGRVLALFAAPVFGGGFAPTRITALARLLSRGYVAQLRTAMHGGGASADEVRTKSVTPHLLLGHIASLTCTDIERDRILHLAQLTGELFGQLDDILDAAEDAVEGHANSITAPARRADGGAEELILQTLDGPALPDAVAKLIDIIIALVNESSACDPAVATEWLQFIFAYVARAYR